MTVYEALNLPQLNWIRRLLDMKKLGLFKVESAPIAVINVESSHDHQKNFTIRVYCVAGSSLLVGDVSTIKGQKQIKSVKDPMTMQRDLLSRCLTYAMDFQTLAIRVTGGVDHVFGNWHIGGNYYRLTYDQLIQAVRENRV